MITDIDFTHESMRGYTIIFKKQPPTHVMKIYPAITCGKSINPLLAYWRFMKMMWLNKC